MPDHNARSHSSLVQVVSVVQAMIGRKKKRSSELRQRSGSYGTIWVASSSKGREINFRSLISVSVEASGLRAARKSDGLASKNVFLFVRRRLSEFCCVRTSTSISILPDLGHKCTSITKINQTPSLCLIYFVFVGKWVISISLSSVWARRTKLNQTPILVSDLFCFCRKCLLSLSSLWARRRAEGWLL